MVTAADRTARLIIRGRVQGVGYRAWALATARGLGLKGWVRNRRDGTVEVLAAGPADRLDAFEAACWEGPPAALVAAITRAEAGDLGATLSAGFNQAATV